MNDKILWCKKKKTLAEANAYNAHIFLHFFLSSLIYFFFLFAFFLGPEQTFFNWEKLQNTHVKSFSPGECHVLAISY